MADNQYPTLGIFNQKRRNPQGKIKNTIQIIQILKNFLTLTPSCEPTNSKNHHQK